MPLLACCACQVARECCSTNTRRHARSASRSAKHTTKWSSAPGDDTDRTPTWSARTDVLATTKSLDMAGMHMTVHLGTSQSHSKPAMYTSFQGPVQELLCLALCVEHSPNWPMLLPRHPGAMPDDRACALASNDICASNNNTAKGDASSSRQIRNVPIRLTVRQARYGRMARSQHGLCRHQCEQRMRFCAALASARSLAST
jgi:hypothetical protein